MLWAPRRHRAVFRDVILSRTQNGGPCSKSSRCRFSQGASATQPYGEFQRVGDHSVGVRQKNSSSLQSGPSGPGAMASRSTRPRASAAVRAAPRSGASFAGSGHLPGGLASGVGRQSKGSTSGPWVGIEAEAEPDRGLAQTRTGRLVPHALRWGSRAGVSGLAEFFCCTGRQPVGAPHTAGSPRPLGKTAPGAFRAGSPSPQRQRSAPSGKGGKGGTLL